MNSHLAEAKKTAKAGKQHDQEQKIIQRRISSIQIHRVLELSE
jgi:hypothetical protein